MDNLNLNDTVKPMLSDDYRERLKAEYWQLRIRIKKLSKFLDEHENGFVDLDVGFIDPDIGMNYRSLLCMQLAYMISYKNILEQRAIVDDIELGEMG